MQLRKLETPLEVTPAPADTPARVAKFYEKPDQAEALMDAFIRTLVSSIDIEEPRELNAINTLLWKMINDHKEMQVRRNKSRYIKKFSIESLVDLIEVAQSDFEECMKEIHSPDNPPSGSYEYSDENMPTDLANDTETAIIDVLTGEAFDLNQEEPSLDDLATMEKFLQEEFPELLKDKKNE